jgi:1,4-alpha-glucan branching enzyme
MKKTLKKSAYTKVSTKGRPAAPATKSKTTGQTAKSKTAGQKTKSKPGKPKPAPLTTLKKQYLKSSPVCKVTFRLPKDAAPDAMAVSVVGEFNNWDMSEHQMKKMKNGDFTATLELPCNREYRFRYLIDSCRWENDWCADKYLPNEHGSDDSVVVV